MLITRVTADVLRVPLPRPRTLPKVDDPDPGNPPTDSLAVLLVRLDTNDGATGLGFAYATSGRALVAIVEDELAPRLLGADPWLHERLYAKLRHDRPLTPGLAAVDIAVWALKGTA